MRKIKAINLGERHDLTSLSVNWGEVYLFKNKDKAKRAAVKLNKHYTRQLQRLNYLLADVYRSWRIYWLYLKPFDNEQIHQRLGYVEQSLEAALDYQDQFFNSPAAISRALADLVSVCDSLLLYAEKRKDIPLQHQIQDLKQRAEFISNSKPSINERKHKRAAVRNVSAGGSI